MNAVALQSFGFGEQLVRVVDRDGGIWFVANDVCAALELKNPRTSLALLEEDERDGVHTVDAMGRMQETTIISESGLYSLIFRSRKPVAIQFRKWVTGEVLPAIRLTGRYDHHNDEAPAAPRAPRTGEELEETRVSIKLVEMAQRLRGTEAALRVWRAEGLPPEIDDRETLAIQAEGWGVLPVIRDWVAARIERAAGMRARMTALYDDYLAFCADRGAEPLTMRAFSGQLDQLGLEKRKSNGMYRMGVKLL